VAVRAHGDSPRGLPRQGRLCGLPGLRSDRSVVGRRRRTLRTVRAAPRRRDVLLLRPAHRAAGPPQETLPPLQGLRVGEGRAGEPARNLAPRRARGDEPLLPVRPGPPDPRPRALTLLPRSEPAPARLHRRLPPPEVGRLRSPRCALRRDTFRGRAPELGRRLLRLAADAEPRARGRGRPNEGSGGMNAGDRATGLP